MTLHGGIIAACGTFFVFSDYMKPAIRMAALMELPVKFIWSHDAFRVGEDGPTHEPVEQEAQIRLMEKLKNHKGKNSMLVLRPADVTEATVAWKMAMENTTTPTGLIFSRQAIHDLPAHTNRYQEALQAEKGAYIVESDENPDVILVASGSEVATLEEGAVLLRAEGIRVRIVSVPSEGLFRCQSKAYQESVIPAGSKVFGLTAEQMASAGVQCSYSERSEDIILYADKDQMSQIIINLMKNAVQAGADRIDITAGIDDTGNVIIDIANNGDPISMESREEIFIPFFTTRPEGSGIGLSLSRQIMRMHNGLVRLSRSDNESTVFTLIFR